MSAPSAERRAELVENILARVDPRSRGEAEAPAIAAWPAPSQRFVICGHRATGKSRVLPLIAELTGRNPIDLDRALEARFGRPLAEWVRQDQASFRAAERALFAELDPRALVSLGGGFLSLHGDLLEDAFALLLPIRFETYRARLLADTHRPRLRPELSLEEEIAAIFTEREAAHAQVKTVRLSSFLAAARPPRSRAVVTLPPGADPLPFATRSKNSGAELLEVRTDLHELLSAEAVSTVIPLLVSERGREIPAEWSERAALVDLERPGGSLRSFHAPEPLSREAALAHWAKAERGVHIKHVEPLGAPEDGRRLLELQAELQWRHGAERVTVLATGPLALPFRAILAERNALDYLALTPDFAAAPGQRLLSDALRSRGGIGLRCGILGSGITHSRSPRIHPPPFDRIDLPEDAPVGALVDALWPHYFGFAVTSPFKKTLARHIGSEHEAINTLVRAASGWRGFNTDVDGARAALERLGAGEGPLTFLGDGGATVALLEAARPRATQVLRRSELGPSPITGEVVWTWPAHVEPPQSLRFERARVGVIAYGPPGKRIAETIRLRGGTPVPLGACWLIAQARRQRALWQEAR